MAYETFKKIKTKQQFLATQESQYYAGLSAEIQNVKYNIYVVKCKVFQRDNFECQNSNCETPDSPLTRHHYKFRKNGGKDTVRNNVTICKDCHDMLPVRPFSEFFYCQTIVHQWYNPICIKLGYQGGIRDVDTCNFYSTKHGCLLSAFNLNLRPRESNTYNEVLNGD